MNARGLAGLHRRLEALLERGHDVPMLLTRIVLGHAFVLTGLGKLKNLDGVTEFFGNLGIPFPGLNAAFVAGLEFLGGFLLIAGLLTRVTSLLLIATLVVALMTADRAAFIGGLALRPDNGLMDLPAFVYLLFLAWLAHFGPGAVSIDRRFLGAK